MGEYEDAVDPPVLNPDPVERVKLYVIAPAALDVRMVAVYRIGTWLGMFGGGGTYCGTESDRHPQPGAGMSHALASNGVPIDLKWDGRMYIGEFFIDRFFQGRCHWEFSSLDTSSPAKNSVSLFSKDTINYNFDTTHSNGVYDQSPIQSADLWCTADPDPGPTKGKMICTSLGYFQRYPGVVDSRLLAHISSEQREHIPLVNIFPFTKSITLRFHDLEAENRAATSAVAP